MSECNYHANNLMMNNFDCQNYSQFQNIVSSPYRHHIHPNFQNSPFRLTQQVENQMLIPYNQEFNHSSNAKIYTNLNNISNQLNIPIPYPAFHSVQPPYEQTIPIDSSLPQSDTTSSQSSINKIHPPLEPNTSLENSSDLEPTEAVEILKLNQIFLTFAEFEQIATKHWNETFQLFTKFQSDPDENIVYKFVHYKCIYHKKPDKIKTKGDFKRPIQHYNATGCQAECRVKILIIFGHQILFLPL